MYQYNWQSCPIPVRAQIQTLCEQVSAALGDTLIGIYLHGSLALGCFNPERSDLDLLVVNAQPMSVETKRHIVGLLLQISKRPGPLEISFLVLPDLRPFAIPRLLTSTTARYGGKRSVKIWQTAPGGAGMRKLVTMQIWLCT